MSTIAIKQNKKGTFLDLSKEDLASEDFLSRFSNFTGDASKFLSGTSVSLILPDDLDFSRIGGDSRGIVERLKLELNKNNISIKSLTSSTKSETLSEKAIPRSRMQAEVKEETHEDKEVLDVSALPETLYVEANLRSGQLIRYPGNVFVLGDVNPSAEIIAAGDVIVWGTLRGIVHAGADGDTEAKVIAIKLKAGQIRIADKILSINKDSAKKSIMKLLGLGGTKAQDNIVPVLAKIQNNEIMIRGYF